MGTQIVNWANVPGPQGAYMQAAEAFVVNAAAGRFTPSDAPGTLTADIIALTNFVSAPHPQSFLEQNADMIRKASARFGLNDSNLKNAMPPLSATGPLRVAIGIEVQKHTEDLIGDRYFDASYADGLGLYGDLDGVLSSPLVERDVMVPLLGQARSLLWREMENVQTVDYNALRDIGSMFMSGAAGFLGFGITFITALLLTVDKLVQPNLLSLLAIPAVAAVFAASCTFAWSTVSARRDADNQRSQLEECVKTITVAHDDRDIYGACHSQNIFGILKFANFLENRETLDAYYRAIKKRLSSYI